MEVPVAKCLDDLHFSTWSKGPVFQDAGRVGPTADTLHVGGEEGVVTVGGATSEGTFSDSHFFSWESFSWRTLPWEGLPARYEHCSFVKRNESSSNLMVFGGGHQEGCFNDIHQNDDGWSEVIVHGTPPSPRTFHMPGSTVCHRNNVFVFGGGAVGGEAVPDRRLHVLCLDTMTWCRPDTHGEAPETRHGHAMVVVDDTLCVHGGMAANGFFNDLHSLDLTNHHWSCVETGGSVPGARAAHSACSYSSRIILYGGMSVATDTNGETAPCCLGDLCILDFKQKIWSSVKLAGPTPGPRCDYAMCIVELALSESSQRCDEGASPSDGRNATPPSPEVASAAGAVVGDGDCADGQQLVTLLSAEGNSPAGTSLSALLPSSSSSGKQVVLCILGGMNTMPRIQKVDFLDEFLLLPLTQVHVMNPEVYERPGEWREVDLELMMSWLQWSFRILN